MKKEKSCGVIVFKDEEVLLVRHWAGHWDFPKGHVEKGESEEETARREVLEETGLEVSIQPGFRRVINYMVKGHIPKEVVYFLGRPLAGELKAQESEVSEVTFLDYEAAKRRITFESNRDLLEEAWRFLKDNPNYIKSE